MKHALLGIALLAALGCADGAEIPAVELGGPTGARLMNGQGRTPSEAYENAYATLHRQHYNVRRNLEHRNPSVFAARGAMDEIVSALETMKALAGPADRARFDPFLARYRGWSADLAANRWGGSFIQDVTRSEYEVKDTLSPSNVEVLVEFPGARPAPTPAPAPAPAPVAQPGPAPPGVPDDKAVAPERPAPTAPKAPPPVPAPAAPAAPSASAARLFYKAWDRSHDDLLAAYKAKKDCRALYEDVIAALRQLQANTPPEKAGKLTIYLDYYAGIHDKTKGFTVLPEGEKIAEKDIVDELDVAARVIRKEFNPEK
jgi:hypothetical protein